LVLTDPPGARKMNAYAVCGRIERNREIEFCGVVDFAGAISPKTFGTGMATGPKV
jgi:hypothetical protein